MIYTFKLTFNKKWYLRRLCLITWFIPRKLLSCILKFDVEGRCFIVDNVLGNALVNGEKRGPEKNPGL